MKTFTLNNGMTVPVIGFGTCKHSYDKPIDEIILNAIECGYRYFDTASFYQTERDLGRAVKSSGLKRDSYMVASKLWYEELGYEKAKIACKNSLKRLGLDYIDIYLIHWPKSPGDDSGWKETLKATWKALEELKEEGLVKAVGVSNFLPHHLEVLKESSEMKPVVDQLELHPGYFQEYAVRYLKENDILPQAWSPVGRGSVNFKTNEIVASIANKYKVSSQKLALRFLNQRGVMPLPWSTEQSHIKENMTIFDFEISEEDISMISCMPQQTWLGEHPDFYLPVAKHLNQNQ